MLISEPEMLKVRSLPSASVAVTVPMAVWFSSAVKEAPEVMVGLSFISLIATVISCVTELVPSEAVTVAE